MILLYLRYLFIEMYSLHVNCVLGRYTPHTKHNSPIE